MSHECCYISPEQAYNQASHQAQNQIHYSGNRIDCNTTSECCLAVRGYKYGYLDRSIDTNSNLQSVVAWFNIIAAAFLSSRNRICYTIIHNFRQPGRLGVLDYVDGDYRSFVRYYIIEMN